MSRQESSNGLHLIKYANILLKGRYSELFMGTFAMVTPLALVLIIPMIFAMLFEVAWILSIGIALFVILVGPMQLGYIKYFNETVDGKQPKLSVVYSELRFTGYSLRGVYIAAILLGLYLVGGLLWLVTAGFMISFFSMSLFFLERFKYPRLTVAMKECAKHMMGNRLAMFAYKLIFYFVYFLLFIVGGLSIALVYTVSLDSLLVAWFTCICCVIIFIFLYSMITLHFHASNQIFFEDLLMYRARMKAKEKREEKKLQEQKEEVASEEKKEPIVEEKKEESKQEEKKEKVEEKKKSPVTKKPATKKVEKTKADKVK